MNILPATSDDPVGAAALLGHADPAELKRFTTLEDAVWGTTTLSPAVVESVRLHCAKIRGCEFCAAVRYKPAIEDGLSEAQIAHLGTPDARGEFNAEQSAALTLVDHYLRDPRKPDDDRAAEIASVLGTAGVMEVLIACGAFASADLRIALGENREPNGSTLFDRTGVHRTERSGDTDWPELDGAILDPATSLPGVASTLAAPVNERIDILWSGADMTPDLVAACITRSAQLLGVDEDDAVRRYLVPPRAAELVEFDAVREWPRWSEERGRHELSLAEQLWMDPAGVDDSITGPLLARRGADGLIRVAWNLILIGQLHRLALVLHRSG